MAATLPAAWLCDGGVPSLQPERTYLRYDLTPGETPPRYFSSERLPLYAVHTAIIGEDGSAQIASFGPKDFGLVFGTSRFSVPVPEAQGQARHVVVAIDGAIDTRIFEAGALSVARPGQDTAAHDDLLIASLLCGLLIMPLIFNVAFYRILREKFILWHSALAVSNVLLIATKSALLTRFTPIPQHYLTDIQTVVFGLSVASAGMFAYHFIEPDKLDPRLRRALLWAAGWTMLITVGRTFFPFVGRAVQTDLYFAAFLPVLVLYIAMLGSALMRGSRAAKYQLAGWLPLILVGVSRIFTQLVPGVEATDAMLLFHIGCVIEVFATTLGIADRLMTIKVQRDRAVREAQIMEELSERDTLTGILNRRAIERRFDRLRHEGFNTLALLDLDLFKQINDRFGHKMGDDVLRAVGEVLRRDVQRQSVAVRMGGEEFLLMLSGEDGPQRAERIRQAISIHVAHRVDALDRAVTASMGIVRLSGDADERSEFDDLYQRADRLLYLAKRRGRNRSVTEPMAGAASSLPPKESNAAA